MTESCANWGIYSNIPHLVLELYRSEGFFWRKRVGWIKYVGNACGVQQKEVTSLVQPILQYCKLGRRKINQNKWS